MLQAEKRTFAYPRRPLTIPRTHLCPHVQWQAWGHPGQSAYSLAAWHWPPSLSPGLPSYERGQFWPDNQRVAQSHLSHMSVPRSQEAAVTITAVAHPLWHACSHIYVLTHAIHSAQAHRPLSQHRFPSSDPGPWSPCLPMRKVLTQVPFLSWGNWGS